MTFSTAEAKKLRAFLVGLESNDAALARFRADPAGELSKAGLSAKTVSALTRKDADTVLVASKVAQAVASDFVFEVGAVQSAGRARSLTRRSSSRRRPARKRR